MLADPHTLLLKLTDNQYKPLAEFCHYPVHNLLYVTWHGHLRADEVVLVAGEHLQLQAELHTSHLFNDKTDSSGDWQEALPYLHYEWLPLAKAAGLRAMAYLFSPDVAARFVSKDFVAAVRPHLNVELFSNADEAWAWLLAQR
jgi:hypothetical protein